jgi:hypothetical protein
VGALAAPFNTLVMAAPMQHLRAGAGDEEQDFVAV